MNQRYRYCGFVLDSDLPLPELDTVTAGTANSDIRIRRFRAGKVPSNLNAYGPNWALGPDEGWWWLEDRVVFRVQPGAIDVDAKDTEGALVRALLLEAPMIMAMIFQEAFCLNAASVKLGDETIVFCGAAGSGRSTAAARLALKGGHLITDSLARIDASEGSSPQIIPQGSGCLLWPHALTLLGLPADHGRPVRLGTKLRRLFLDASPAPQPVDRLYWRHANAAHHIDEQVSKDLPTTRQRFSRIACITAGHLWIDPAGRSTAHFQWCLQLARSCHLAPAPNSHFQWTI